MCGLHINIVALCSLSSPSVPTLLPDPDPGNTVLLQLIRAAKEPSAKLSNSLDIAFSFAYQRFHNWDTIQMPLNIS